MKILITSGGTKVSIDRVRSITNMSQGTFGSRIADAFFSKGLAAFRTGNEHEKSHRENHLLHGERQQGADAPDSERRDI